MAQAARRRAVSTAYYAIFHHLAWSSAELLIGSMEADTTSRPAWVQAYRALEHGAIYNACRHRETVSKFPRAIEDYAGTFVAMQDRRVLADYDPIGVFRESDVLAQIDGVAFATDAFDREQAKDRRAFCAYVVLRQPRLRTSHKPG